MIPLRLRREVVSKKKNTVYKRHWKRALNHHPLMAHEQLTGATSREWMGMGVAGMIMNSYEMDHSLISYWCVSRRD